MRQDDPTQKNIEKQRWTEMLFCLADFLLGQIAEKLASWAAEEKSAGKSSETDPALKKAEAFIQQIEAKDPAAGELDAGALAAFLVAQGASLSAKIGERSEPFPVLTRAIVSGKEKAVAALLAVCDAKAANDRGQTPLIFASSNRKMTELLLPASDARAADQDGQTALMRAASFRDVECVKLLLPSSDANAQDKRGRTALMWACDLGVADCAAFLASRSDASLKDDSGRTAFDLACKSRAWGCVDALASFCDLDALKKAAQLLPPNQDRAEKMPAIHAVLEREELRKTLRDTAAQTAASAAEKPKQESLAAKENKANRGARRV